MHPWDPEHLAFDEEAFSGVARLFPLPGLVMFPHTVQQLHIFEERYRAMTADALASDGLIAIAQLKPNWETDYAGRPPLREIACLGKIIAHHKLEDGRYSLLLLGLRRLHLGEEIDPPIAYRRAQVELLAETEGELTVDELTQLHKSVGAAIRKRLPDGPAAEQLQNLLTGELPLAVLTDLVAYTLQLPDEIKLQLLGEPCAAKRAQTLLSQIANLAEESPLNLEGPLGGLLGSKDEGHGFPPPFSAN